MMSVSVKFHLHNSPCFGRGRNANVSGASQPQRVYQIFPWAIEDERVRDCVRTAFIEKPHFYAGQEFKVGKSPVFLLSVIGDV